MEKLLQIECYKTDTFQSRCDSINRKNIALQLKLKNILCLINSQQQLDEINQMYLASECADYLEKLYSIMNYSTSVMSEILSERGNSYGDNFHGLVEKVLKNPTIYSAKTMTIIQSTFSWYPLVHDMRSEEAHFSMGKVTIEDGKYFYSINRATRRKTMNDLLQEFNQSESVDNTTYKILIEDLKKIHIQYGTKMAHLVTAINCYYTEV